MGICGSTPESKYKAVGEAGGDSNDEGTSDSGQGKGTSSAPPPPALAGAIASAGPEAEVAEITKSPSNRQALVDVPEPDVTPIPSRSRTSSEEQHKSAGMKLVSVAAAKASAAAADGTKATTTHSDFGKSSDETRNSDPPPPSPSPHFIEAELRRLTAAGVRSSMEDTNGSTKADLELVADVLAGNDHALYPPNSTDSLWHVASGRGSVNLLTTLKLYCEKAWPQLEAMVQEEGAKREEAELPSAPGAFVKQMLSRLNAKSQTPLMLSCMHGRADTVAFILQQDVDLWQVARGNRTALHYAALAGHTRCCVNLLSDESLTSKNGQRYVNAQSLGGATALHYAVASKHVAVVDLLLTNGADFCLASTEGASNTYIDKASGTPLHVAALIGSKDTATCILKHYAASQTDGKLLGPDNDLSDPRQIPNQAGRLPYKLAERYQHPALAEMLHPKVDLSLLYFSGENASASNTGPPTRSWDSRSPASSSSQLQIRGQAPSSAAIPSRASWPTPSSPSAADRATARGGGDGGTPTVLSQRKTIPQVDFGAASAKPFAVLSLLKSEGNAGPVNELLSTNGTKCFQTAVETAQAEAGGAEGSECSDSGSDNDSGSEYGSESDYTDNESDTEADLLANGDGSMPRITEKKAVHQAAPRAPAAVTGIGSGIHFTPPPRRRKKHRSSLRRKAMRLAAKKSAMDEGQAEGEVNGEGAEGVSHPGMCALCPNAVAEVLVDGCGHRMCRDCAVSACSEDLVGCPVCKQEEEATNAKASDVDAVAFAVPESGMNQTPPESALNQPLHESA